jgi:nitrogen fixation/metabolism regulation signal transduction histidine kinase
MDYYKFYFKIIIRVALILVNLFLIAVVITGNERLFSSIILISALLLQILELVNFNLRYYRKINSFLETLKFHDSYIQFDKKFPPTKELYKTFNSIITTIENTKAEKESKHEYIKSLIHNIPVGIFTLTKDNDVEFCNNRVLELLEIENLNSIEIFKNTFHEFYNCIISSKGDLHKLIELNVQSKKKTLSLKINHFVNYGIEKKIISIQDISGEIENKEMSAWQDLMKILGHEILNSITPVSSLNETSIMLAKREFKNYETNANQSKIIEVLNKTDIRLKGLIEFISNYRKFTKLPNPSFETIYISKFIQNIISLLKEELACNQIIVEIEEIDDNIAIQIDKTLIEQVILNILRNAIQAMKTIKEDRKISISCREENSKKEIIISDNGIGIPKDIIDKIFVPFFTTKEEGTGIGLSLSKQIMHAHNGNIHIYSEQGKGSHFVLEFNK